MTKNLWCRINQSHHQKIVIVSDSVTSISGETTKDLQGTGLGDGQGDQATTNDLESEDIFEGAEKPKRPDEEDEERPEEQEEKTKEEDGVEMSGDLDAQMQVRLLKNIRAWKSLIQSKTFIISCYVMLTATICLLAAESKFLGPPPPGPLAISGLLEI